MIKRLSDIEPIEGFSRTETALLKENNIDISIFNDLFPDYKKEIDGLNWEIKRLSKLKKAKDFSEFIQKNREKRFCIIGDYDADGILATLNMLLGLSYLGIQCSFIIPNRLEDYYGISEKHIDRAIADKTDVLITVDNGIGCKKAVAYAKSKGLDVIVTDHHIPVEGEIPEDVLIIDPKFNGDSFVDICGTNVAFKLMLDLLEREGKLEKQDCFYTVIEMAVFAGIATITDMMPSFGENRRLVKAMLAYVNSLKERDIWGGRILKIIKNLGGAFIINNPDVKIDEDTFSFFVGPTLNAIGRIKGNVESMVSDILALPENKVDLRRYLAINRERKKLTQVLVESHVENDDTINIELLNQEDFEFPIAGLIGLVANKILSSENKVSIAGFIRDGFYEFSCRSPQGYSIHEGFERIKEAHPELGLDGGGHDSAMGMRFEAKQEKLDALKQYLTEDFLKYSERKENVVYVFEPEMKDEIIEAYENFGLFGPSFKKLKFMISGPLHSFGDNFIRIGKTSLEYRTPEWVYYSKENAASKATFDIKFSNDGPYFRLEKLVIEGLND